MPRALLIVLDSVGVGHAPDADDFTDEGANTLGHIYESQKASGFSLPFLESLGLDLIMRGAAGEDISADFDARKPPASIGWMKEASLGKDTTTGHWEMAGCITEVPFSLYDMFPQSVIEPIEEICNVRFIGNYPQSGTMILEELGEEHYRTGNPILYTSADSVMQIAAHEEIIPVDLLYEMCEVAREFADKLGVARVIARPFVGKIGSFERTSNRKDFSMVPPYNVLNKLNDAGKPVVGIGKISDIFAGKGISGSNPTTTNTAGMHAIEEQWSQMEDGLVFANLVDFDTKFGHCRDPAGYAQCLDEFDQWFAKFVETIGPDDLVLVTADHGNDPTWRGTDHTREMVPLIAFAPGEPELLGERSTFADIASTLTTHFGFDPWPTGTPFL